MSATEADASCLDEVSSFAVKICGEIQKSETRKVVDINGKIDAGVSKIIKRVVGGGSGDLSESYLEETYSNVVQDQLGSQIFNDIACRKAMVDIAVSQSCLHKMPEVKKAKGGLVISANEAILSPDKRIISININITNTGEDALLIFVPQRANFSLVNTPRKQNIYADSIANCADGLMDIGGCAERDAYKWTSIDAGESLKTHIIEKMSEEGSGDATDLNFLIMMRRGNTVNNYDFHFNDIAIG